MLVDIVQVATSVLLTRKLIDSSPFVPRARTTIVLLPPELLDEELLELDELLLDDELELEDELLLDDDEELLLEEELLPPLQAGN
jgi:hypothetical protein